MVDVARDRVFGDLQFDSPLGGAACLEDVQGALEKVRSIKL